MEQLPVSAALCVSTLLPILSRESHTHILLILLCLWSQKSLCLHCLSSSTFQIPHPVPEGVGCEVWIEWVYRSTVYGAVARRRSEKTRLVCREAIKTDRIANVFTAHFHATYMLKHIIHSHSHYIITSFALKWVLGLWCTCESIWEWRASWTTCCPSGEGRMTRRRDRRSWRGRRVSDRCTTPCWRRSGRSADTSLATR